MQFQQTYTGAISMFDRATQLIALAQPVAVKCRTGGVF